MLITMCIIRQQESERDFLCILPSAKAFFSMSCLAWSLEMRLLPSRYSRNFWGLKNKSAKFIFLALLVTVAKYEHHTLPFSHSEVEELRLLLIGPSLSQTRFIQVAVRHAGLDRLGGRAVGEALGDIVVIQHRHVLQGGQRCTPGLLHLQGVGTENVILFCFEHFTSTWEYKCGGLFSVSDHRFLTLAWRVR